MVKSTFVKLRFMLPALLPFFTGTEGLRGARLVSNPGCYVTAALLALAPLARRGLLRPGAPLFVDGIRVYLPADNRLDLGFFLTANLAQIQVEKGYVSVLSGPGAIGGALNLVTKKPTQPFEYEARAGDSPFDGVQFESH